MLFIYYLIIFKFFAQRAKEWAYKTIKWIKSTLKISQSHVISKNTDIFQSKK